MTTSLILYKDYFNYDIKEILYNLRTTRSFKLIVVKKWHNRCFRIVVNVCQYQLPLKRFWRMLLIFTLSKTNLCTGVNCMPLKKQQSQQAISYKSSQAIKQFFAEVVPEFDPARVYASDMKKIINWYNILQAKDMLDIIKPSEETKAVTEETVEETDIEKDVE